MKKQEITYILLAVMSMPAFSVLRAEESANKGESGKSKINNSVSLRNDLKDLKAEGRRFLFGISAGGGVAGGMYDYRSQTPPPEFSYLPVPAFGLNLDWRLFNGLAIQSNLLYKQKGDNIDMDKLAQKIYSETEHVEGASVSATGYTKTKISYIEVSLLPVMVIGRKVELGVGGFAAYGLSGERKRDFTLAYNFGNIKMPDETYQETKKAKFITLMQETDNSEELYLNRIDYGVYGHFGIRLNPVKLSVGLSYSLNTWEPDSKISGLFVEKYDLTRSIAAVVLISWFFGTR